MRPYEFVNARMKMTWEKSTFNKFPLLDFCRSPIQPFSSTSGKHYVHLKISSKKQAFLPRKESF